jgi:tetratricopeptide (TPR) repeat protein
MVDSSPADLARELNFLVDNGQLDQAQKIYLQLLRLAESLPEYWEILGSASLRLGLLSNALDFLGRSVKGGKAPPSALLKYSRALTMAGQHNEAIETGMRLLADEPKNAAIHLNLANNLRIIGKSAKAMEHAQRALELQPDYPPASIQLAILWQSKGKYRKAIRVLRIALKKRPSHPMLHLRLGNLLMIQEEFDEAIAAYDKALGNQPDLVQAWLHKAGAQAMLSRLDTALSSYRKARALRPDFEDAIAGEAGILMLQGDTEGALSCIQPLVDRGSRNVFVAAQFAELSRKAGNTDQALDLIQRLLHAPDRPASEEARLHFSAGDLYAQRKDFDQAFVHYLQANKLKYKPQAAARELQYLRTCHSVFTGERLRTLPRASTNSERPVFIVGMPRSGTSLVEQVLASHPAVFGAGELIHINRIANNLHITLHSQQHFPQCIDQLTEAAANELAAGYLQHLEALSPNAMRVTDKMPHNFLNLGLIELLFPGARVIHCRRNPMDNCLSCFTHDLSGSHAYSYDLAMLGEYYRAYQQLMQHWQQVLTIPLLQLDYEALVTNQEAVTRQLLAFCELEWDMRCLHFYESSRVTATASYDQVRQPLYQGAIGKWRDYENHLRPLNQALDHATDRRGPAA